MTLSTILAALEPSPAQGISQGISIALAGMLIVGVALSLISIFISRLPHVLAIVAKFWPEAVEPHAKSSHPESLVADNDAVLAAIGYVLHCEFQKQLQSDGSATSDR